MVKDVDRSLQRGIAALRDALGEDAALTFLQSVTCGAGEAASFLFPLPIDYTGTERHLRIGFPTNFPREQLRLQVEPSPWLIWPHAMESGLCIYGFRERPITGGPESVVSGSLSRLAKIISLSIEGSNDAERNAEFNNEITSYWGRQLKPSLQNLILLDRPTQATSLIALSEQGRTVPSGQEPVWLATDAKTIATHFFRVTGKQVRLRSPEIPAFYIKLHSYPNVRIPDSEELVTWLTPHLTKGDEKSFSLWHRNTASLPSRWIVLELPGNADAPLYCLNIRSSALQKNRGPAFGARSSRKSYASTQTYGRVNIRSSKLDILDRAAIYSRDIVGRNTKRLEASHVVCVGVGSLGGAVAQQLARSGVGHLTLIDPQVLVSENLGRHVLGTGDLGKFKASALKERILMDLPIVAVDSYNETVQSIMKRKPEVFVKADLVVVTSADWDSEVALWEAKSVGAPWGLLQAWSEPHSHVGHVLFAPGGPFDAKHLFSSSGNFQFKCTEWPRGGIIPLPACGESFIPGGSLGMTKVASIASEAALRSLSGSLLDAVWITSIYRPEDVAALGGTYNGPDMSEQTHQLVLEREWPQQEDKVA